MSNREPKPKNSTTSRITAVRGRVLLIAVLVCMLALCARFAYLQVFDPNDYRIAALDQYTNSVTIPAKRGTIYASDGTTELATSATVYNCFISPVDLDEDDALLNKIATELSAILDVDKETVVSKGKKTKSKYQIIKKFLTDTEETAVRNLIKENSQSTANTSLASGSSIAYSKIIHLEETTKRYYRYGSLAAQLIGFTGTDNQGLTGIEANYNEYLAGVNGKSVKAADAYGNELETGVGSSYIPATDGLNIVTTIDWSVQNSVEKYIKQAYEEHKPNGRVECIVMNVTNGEILASAIYPSYDLNNYSDLNEEYQKLYDLFIGTEEERADYKKKLMYEMWNNTLVTQTYEPGSTFKMITAIAGLEEEIITPTTIIKDLGVYTYYSSPQPKCWIWRQAGMTHGRINVSQAIVDSCNYFFYEVGRLTGIQKLDEYATALGLGRSTGIEIGDASGVLASPEWAESHDRKWTDGQTITAAIGQSYNLFTPLQLANYVATLVSGGEHYEAHLLKSVKSYDNLRIIGLYDKGMLNDMNLSDSTMAAVTKGMHDLTHDSLAGAFSRCVVEAGAKTGSAQVGTDIANGTLVVYAPYDDPEIAISLVVEKGGSGSLLANAAVDIINAWFTRGGDTASAGENTLLQ